MGNDLASRVFARLLRHRFVVLAVYALLVPAAAIMATRIPTEAGIERLIVRDDPDYVATRAFWATFPEPQIVLLVFESEDPWSPEELARLDRARAALAGVPHVSTFSILDALRRARPGATPDAMRQLANGTDFFRRQGLAGDHFLTLIANLDVHGPSDATLASIDDALARANVAPVRKVGAPYVQTWLEQASIAATTRSFAIFGVLLVAITLFLYRSLRALLAIMIALGAAVALAVAAGAVLGFSFTIVSALVPLTVMVTTLATLTYLHSRFVDQPADVPLEVHHVIALRNKLLPVTASTIAAATGFAALAVSNIRPIREMGIWTAVGLVIAWIVAYTLFPALQATLRTPTRRSVPVRSVVYDRVASALPGFTYRYRWPLVAGGLATCVAGALAITGVPGLVGGMPIQVDALSNIDPATPLARDLRWFRDQVMDLNIARVWIHLPRAGATDPAVLRGLDDLQTALEDVTDVTAVTGPTTPLRMRSYLSGRGEALPRDPARFESAVADVEQLMLTEPDLRTFIDTGLADVQLQVVFRKGDAAGYAALIDRVQRVWDRARATTPALAGAQLRVVGESLLQVKVGANLVPTLAKSFLLTVACILVVFLVVFRSGTERLLAMIPSLFALLGTFLGLRLFGGGLNIATIIIATTVLGTTENDQLHFFHHMRERSGAGLETRLHHTLRVSGRAVVFATLINAIGFLGLATSSFPPLRQFGLMTSAAFVLALIADFTILPAALWLVFREPPAQTRASESAVGHPATGHPE